MVVLCSSPRSTSAFFFFFFLITFTSLMVLVCYVYHFKYILFDIIMALLTFLHASSALVSIYLYMDCQHVEIVQTKSLSRPTNLRLVFL